MRRKGKGRVKVARKMRRRLERKERRTRKVSTSAKKGKL